MFNLAECTPLIGARTLYSMIGTLWGVVFCCLAVGFAAKVWIFPYFCQEEA